MPVVRGYGEGLYNVGDYGTEGTVKESSALITATSTVNAAGGRNLESPAVINVASTFTSNAVRVGEGDGSVTAASIVTASGESIIIERSDKLPWGAGLYGYNRYDLNDLQTIVSVTSAISVANGLRVRPADGAVSASSGSSASGEVIKLGEMTVSATSGSTANAVYTIKGEATSTAQSSVTIEYIRRRKGSALSTGTSGTLSIGREKWEPIPVTSITWSNVA